MAYSLPSVMSHDFGSIPGPALERSSFDRSHGHKTAFDGGDLIPIFVDEVLPGDTMNLSARFFARLNTMLRPVMDNVFFDTFWFFVPTRILWDNWERFNGSQDNPDDPIDYQIPTLTGDPVLFAQNSIYDYMGLPTKVSINTADSPSVLPLRAYNMIWNEWFRDENMQDSAPFSTDDGPDNISEYSLLKRGKRHDYFTSCLPFAQKGDAVVLPLGGTAPVIGNGMVMGLTDGTDTRGLFGASGTNQLWANPAAYGDPVGSGQSSGLNFNASWGVGVTVDPTRSGMIADLTAATAATINELREAVAFQHILERDARGGTRYTEMLRAHWGVAPRDERLQRPEYLGGSSQRMNISAVAQTSTSNTTTPTQKNVQGNLTAFGTVAERSGFVKSFPEYGYVIGLCNVRADITYQQGLRRMWSRSTRFDFALPDLMHLGEQPVYQKEIYYDDGGDTANEVFGYQERYAEYRYFPSMVTGPFRSNYTGTLDSWHLALDFDAPPALDSAFIQDAPPLDRVLAIASEPNILLDSYINLKHARCMPVYSVPGLERL